MSTASKAASNAIYYAHDEPARRPACMDDADMAAWNALNRSTHGASRADSPCRDCTPLFHRDMLAGGMCDGEPLSAPAPNRGGRPATPDELRGLSVAELRALRADLRVALNRARWREYRRGLRVTA